MGPRLVLTGYKHYRRSVTTSDEVKTTQEMGCYLLEIDAETILVSDKDWTTLGQKFSKCLELLEEAIKKLPQTV